MLNGRLLDTDDHQIDIRRTNICRTFGFSNFWPICLRFCNFHLNARGGDIFANNHMSRKIAKQNKIGNNFLTFGVMMKMHFLMFYVLNSSL